jgi:RecB family exonuclease
VPRKPTISPSKLTTYLACPNKYRWTYVDRRGLFYLRAKSYYSFGTTLHQVLQRFHDASDAGVTTTAEAMAAYEESWISAGYGSAEEMAESYGEGREILERHVEEAIARPSEARTLLVERQLRMNMGEFDLLGRIDRVDEYEDGQIEVVDYKSGRQGVSEEDVREDLAMICYQLLVRERYPDRPVRARIIALRSGTSAVASLSDEEAAGYRDLVHNLGVEVLNREYADLIPVFKPLCSRCDFLPLCRKHEEYEYRELASA